MARVQYESKSNDEHRFWTGRWGRYVVRIDANGPGVYGWLITLEGHIVDKGTAPDRDGADQALSQALDGLPR